MKNPPSPAPVPCYPKYFYVDGTVLHTDKTKFNWYMNVYDQYFQINYTGGWNKMVNVNMESWKRKGIGKKWYRGLNVMGAGMDLKVHYEDDNCSFFANRVLPYNKPHNLIWRNALTNFPSPMQGYWHKYAFDVEKCYAICRFNGWTYKIRISDKKPI